MSVFFMIIDSQSDLSTIASSASESVPTPTARPSHSPKTFIFQLNAMSTSNGNGRANDIDAVQKLVEGNYQEQFAGVGNEFWVLGEQFCETGSEKSHPAEIKETEETGRKKRHDNGNLVVLGLGADDVGEPCRAADPDRERDLEAERRDGRDDRLRGQFQRVELCRQESDHLERKCLRQDHEHAGKAQREERGPFGGELAESGVMVPALVAVDEADVKA
ncbi:hypothetical protein KL941_004801 [Ogataea angusta]|nr:hypothetical protein KL941_004801 [Ogataea angusta]